jgi:hypothetical protein
MLGISSQLLQDLKNICKIYSKDSDTTEIITRLYDPQATLVNTYLILTGREEIIQSYRHFIDSCIDLEAEINSATFDDDQQLGILDMTIVYKPKVLGGISIKLHQMLQLQLEETNGCYLIVKQTEILLGQDLLSQVPLIGSWYESGLRQAMGQLSMASSHLLNKSGILDLVPFAVHKGVQLKEQLVEKGMRLKNSVMGVLPSSKTGVASGSMACYSPTCSVSLGKCYSISCLKARERVA